MITARVIAVTASLLCLSAVGLGAFGAHAFDSILEANQRADVYELANRYHFYHGLALLCLSVIAWQSGLDSRLSTAFVLMLSGVIIFSASLYALALSGVGIFGAITPIGGSLLIIAWVFLGWHLYKRF